MTALRRAKRDDLPAVTALQRAAYDKNRAILGVEPLPLMADYAQIFSQYEVYLAERDGALDGVLILEPRADDLLIWSVATAPAAQGRGVGNGMLAFAETRAGELGLSCIRLYTGEPLTANIAWYQRHGYARERIEDMGDRRIVHLIKQLGKHEEAELAGRLKGKVALVTAAGQGIGRAIAEAFVAEGATVIATDLDLKKLKGLKRATLARLDARSTADVNALVKEMTGKVGPIDVLVNAAGYVHHNTVLDCSDADWDFAFDLNVRSMHRTIKATLPGMLKKGRGSIINIASGASSVRGIPFRYVYGTTKAAVIGLTKSVAADFIKQGIRVNAICPGTIVSPSLDDRIATLAKNTGKSEKVVRQAFIDRQPMGRLGTPQEIAALAVYLASDESSYTTGQIHLADGGFAL